jgi:hypothetical protein
MADLNGDMSATTKQFDQLTLHEGPKSSDDNPTVIIPDHLQVSNADCAHLTFDSSGTIDASLTTKPLECHGDAATVPDDQSMDQTDVRYVFYFLVFFAPILLCSTYKPSFFLFRIHEYGSKATATPAADEYAASVTYSNLENLDVISVQQSEVTRASFLDVINNTGYNLSSTSDFAASSVALQDSASHNYLQ